MTRKLAFTALSRPSKIRCACLALLLFLLVFSYIPRNGLADKTGGLDLRSWSSQGTVLAESPHQSSTADAFLPHFRAVLEMPDVTFEDAKSSCNWNASEQIDFQFREEVDWHQKTRSEEEINSKRKQWHDFVENAVETSPYSHHQHKFSGRGIVVIAGDGETLIRVEMLLKALTRLGSQLPVEVHYYDQEMSEQFRVRLTNMRHDIYFNDLSSPTNVVKTTYGPQEGRNYQFKTAALINSRYAEPLMLDADNIPVIDPASLYESSAYKDYGTLFWPDIARTRPTNPIWPITNTYCRMNEYEQESGQLLVDKRRYFYHLLLSHFFASDALYYGQILLGDKDLFRFSWHALRTKYGSPSKSVTSAGTLREGFYCGHTFAQYHPDGRIAFMHAGLLKTMAKQVMKWERETNGGVYQVYKRSEYDDDPGMIVQSRIKFDTADYLPAEFKTGGEQVGWCVDFDQVSTRPLDEILPGFETVFEEIGGYWPIQNMTATTAT